jgi:mRNA interferase MazF
MGIFAKRDIVIFPFPYTDLSEKKIRPCLVISNELNQDIILSQITSQNIKKDKYSVGIKNSEVIDGSLQINSFVRCNMIFTANKNQIIKKICRIKKDKYDEVVSKILNIISD